ncbi:hypothetical protein [Streptomyces sp. XY431]|uniref:hypothetical protein n=1 Tax=Streptomyces sp. XY431 TaxID=1415562 RepID=UPI0006ADF2EA|nr:hypothetical protein [Streptomyces sp. XY431]
MHVDLKLGDHPVANIRVRGGLFGEDWPAEREHLPGWGALIEVPAVLEILDLVVAGHLDIARARRTIAHIGERTVRRIDPHGCGTKGCTDGNHCRGEFEEDRLREVLRRDRADAALAVEPTPADQPATHPCQPCGDCARCSCFDGNIGICQQCQLTRSARARAHQDLSRWNTGLAAGKTYARTERRLHRWNCPTLGNPEDRLADFEALLQANRGRADWTPLPDLHSADELRRQGNQTRRCATCGPDPL